MAFIIYKSQKRPNLFKSCSKLTVTSSQTLISWMDEIVELFCKIQYCSVLQPYNLSWPPDLAPVISLSHSLSDILLAYPDSVAIRSCNHTTWLLRSQVSSFFSGLFISSVVLFQPVNCPFKHHDLDFFFYLCSHFDLIM